MYSVQFYENTVWCTAGLYLILFLIHKNDIAYSCPYLNMDLYADDSTLFRSDTNLLKIETNLQTNLDITSKWCNINNMALHPKKTKCMVHFLHIFYIYFFIFL